LRRTITGLRVATNVGLTPRRVDFVAGEVAAVDTHSDGQTARSTIALVAASSESLGRS